MFEIIIHASITLRLNFDIKSNSWEKFDAESLVNAEESVSLNISNSLSSAENTSILNLKQIMMYMLSFLKSETSEASYFSRVDIMKFLYQFYKLEKHHKVIDMKLIKMLCEWKTEKNKKNWVK